MEIELLSTTGCHLCELAEQVLVAVLPDFDARVACYVVDIADDDSLVERYGTRIPLLRTVDATRELGWPFDEQAVRQFLSLAV